MSKQYAKNIQVNFQGQACEIAVHRYVPSDRLAVRLVKAESGEHVEWATLPHVAGASELKPSQVLVQDFNSSQGMLKALEDAGVVKATGEYRTYLGTQMPVAELLVGPEAPGQRKEAPKVEPPSPEAGRDGPEYEMEL